MRALWVLMALFGLGFAVWLVVDSDERTDLSPHTHSFVLEEKDGRLVLTYVSGQGLPAQDTRILVTVGNERTTLAADEAGLGWQTGESVCIAGPDCMVDGGDLLVQVEYGASIVFQATRTFQ